jgi:hypothetical protein
MITQVKVGNYLLIVNTNEQKQPNILEMYLQIIK